MVMTVMNGAQEIEALTNPPTETNLKRDAEGRFISPDAPAESADVKETQAKAAPKDEADDETPEWVSRGKFTKEQHDLVTEVIKRSIGKKHAQAMTAEEFAEQQYNEKVLAERRAQDLEAELRKVRTTPETEKPVEEAKKPERSAFTDDEAYIEALTEWKTEQKFKEREQKALADRDAAAQQAVVAAAHARVDAVRSVVPDFDEVVSAANIIVPPHIGAFMQESELIGEMGYHFAKHPDELQRISDMPTRTMLDLQRIGIALSKIEGKLTPFASSAKEQAKPSNGAKPSDDEIGDEPSVTGRIPSPKPRAAAPVIQPLNTSSGTQVEKRESAMSYDEARSNWEKRNRRNFDVRKRH